MKKVTIFLIFLGVFNAAWAQSELFCGEVKRMRVWASGSDTYGIWVEYLSSPQMCPGGFYLPHASENKEFLYSLILSAKVAGDSICIQTYPETPDWQISGRCRINYAMHQ